MTVTRQTGRLFVYGDISVDVMVQTDQAPGSGQDAIVRHSSLLPGGSAANCAVVASRLGMQVEFIGLTGSDDTADGLVDDLRSSGVGTRLLRRTPGPVAIIVAIVGRGGERTMYSFRGAASQIDYGDVPPDLMQAGDYLHLSGYSFQDEPSRRTALALIAQARRRGAQVSMDPSFHSAGNFPRTHSQAMADLDFVFPNWDEARIISDGASTPREAARRIRQMGPGTVVVKLGADGCYALSAGEEVHVPAFKTAGVVDTTGAGDAFCGGFLTAVSRGLTLCQAARVGHACAVHVIEQAGGHTGAPDLDRLAAFLDQQGEDDTARALLEAFGEAKN